MRDGFNGERSIVLPRMVVGMEENDELASSLFITDIGYYPHARHHFRERLEPIDQNVLIYCVDGSGFFTLRGERHEVKANEYFILPAGEPHSYGASEESPWTIYWVHFRGQHAAIYAQGATLPRPIAPSLTSRINLRNTLFDEIMDTLEDCYALENLRYASSLLHHYLASVRFVNIYRKGDKSQISVVDAAIHFMKENIEKKLSLRQIADFTGLSPSHFSLRFREGTGHSPLNYFNLLKLQRACQLLAETSLKVNQISYKVGFDDCYYFTRLFTKQMGMPPTQYRAQHKA